ncbi:TetR/AcrR family transcriptional regulator [Acaryochloris marina]|uniref:Transcriptional regulator, TetR family n=1 Tax=Acaryochloris marina (strain MBIC 11017) TaxID=329726 RepID=A8ZK63_ACAM1|nr:TetR/AcrR family transcriptional regulator [Acaryochloris marina]ABW31563.1 transcriptional regulator, TetR family [Acaryochloris marina MBIC11017]
MNQKLNETQRKILNTASDLFYQKGTQHVGINEVIATSGVAKRTLYRWFASKDELIEAVMKHRAMQWLEWFEVAVEDRGNTAKDRLLATFDVLEEWYADPSFRGCPFINVVLEIADASHPAHHISMSVRESIRQYVMRLATEAGVREPEAFSQQYLLLIGGASLMATIEGKSDGAGFARNTLSVLIEAG